MALNTVPKNLQKNYSETKLIIMDIETYKDSSIEELFVFVDIIKSKGELILIKIDGEREVNEVTIVISYPSNLDKSPIQYAGSNVRETLFKALHKYFLENGI